MENTELKASLIREIEDHGRRVRAIPHEISRLQMQMDSLVIERPYVAQEMLAKCLKLIPLEVGGIYRIWQTDGDGVMNMILGEFKGINNCGDLLFNKSGVRGVDLGGQVFSRMFPYDELPLCMFNGDHAPLVHSGHQSSWDDPYDYYAPTCPKCGWHEKPASL